VCWRKDEELFGARREFAMQTSILALALACLLSANASGQSVSSPAGTDDAVVSVRIPVAVLAEGKPLPPGMYEIRLTSDAASSLPGQPAGAQRPVEIISGGKVVARETAEVLRDENLPALGASSQSVQSGTRVEMLKGGEFLRISIKRDGARYLVYLPIRHEEGSEQR
jgi:hypothetical protein